MPREQEPDGSVPTGEQRGEAAAPAGSTTTPQAGEPGKAPPQKPPRTRGHVSDHIGEPPVTEHDS